MARLPNRRRGASGSRFSTARAVARFNVASGRLIRPPMRFRMAVLAASDDAVAWKKSHANQVVA